MGAAAGREPHHRHDREPPDWVISRQRAWGVPIAVFVEEKADGSVEILQDEAVNQRIAEAFEQEGADAWYRRGARERFLGSRANEDWKKVDDILDVWFDSGSTHAFVLEDPEAFPAASPASGASRTAGRITVMYLEGSDQHRGWFQSSLLESCGTRGRAPFDMVLTHGFVLDEHGRKMSKSLGNMVAPQDVIKQSGADILRMWVCASDYADDLRIGPEILKTNVETYRKLRNTIRWMLGSLAHFREEDRVAPAKMPELERLMLHRLAELDALVRQAYADFDYKRIFAALNAFMTVDLSAFYFDIRKDTLYCDPISSTKRKASSHRDRSSVPLHGDLARADALLHRRGSLAVALRRGCAIGASADLSGNSRRTGATMRWRRNGARCGTCAASSPARWRSSARRSASARRWKRIRSCMSPIRSCSRRWSMSISPKSASRRRRRWSPTRDRPTRSACRK